MRQFILFALLTISSSYCFANPSKLANSLNAALKSKQATATVEASNDITIYGGADIIKNPALTPHTIG